MNKILLLRKINFFCQEKQKADKWKRYLTILVVLASSPAKTIAEGVQVPIAWCSAVAFSCGNAPPAYGGPTPTDWDGALQLSCQRFAAAHRVDAFCPCGGTICSSVTNCASVERISENDVGTNIATGVFSLTMVDNFDGDTVSHNSKDGPKCGCPVGAGFEKSGICQCNSGKIWNGESCILPGDCTGEVYLDTCNEGPTPLKNSGSCRSEGNPCDPLTGIKTQIENIFSGKDLRLKLVYNSNRIDEVLPLRQYRFGNGWTFNYGAYLFLLNDEKVGAARPDGKSFEFIPPVSGNLYSSDADVVDSLTKLTDLDGIITGWMYKNFSTQSEEEYDSAGKLIEIRLLSGPIISLVYSDANTPPEEAPTPGLLLQVSSSLGQSIQFFYDAKSRVISVIDMDNNQYSFAYDDATAYVQEGSFAADNLTSVTFPDGAERLYHYNEPANTGGVNLKNHLTGITDENGVRFANWHYDSLGRATISEHFDGKDRVEFTYNTNGSTTVTDVAGSTRIYTSEIILGVVKTASVQEQGATISYSYNASGFLTSQTDRKGNVITYTRDSNGRELSRTEAAGSLEEHTITTEWHSTFNLPTKITELERETIITYDANGNELSRVINDISSP